MQQARKAAAADAVRQQMALGNLPQIEGLTFTDEGLEFRDDTARQAYYDALGGFMGQDSMSQEGGTESTVTVNDPSENALRVFNELKAQSDRDQAPMKEHFLSQKQAIEDLTGANSTYLQQNPTPNIPTPREPNLDTLREQTDILKNALGLETPTNPQPLTPQPEAIPTPEVQAADTTVAQPPAPTAPTQPTTPSQPVVPKGGSNRTATEESRRFKGQANVTYTTPEIDASQDITATTTTRRQTARYDEIETNLRKLAGLSTMTDALNSPSQMEGYQTGNMGNPFRDLMSSRINSLRQWELDAANNGITQDVKKVGEIKAKVGSSSITSGASHDDFGRAKNTVSTTITNPSGGGGGNTDVETFAMGKHTYKEHEDYEKIKTSDGPVRMFFPRKFSQIDLDGKYKDLKTGQLRLNTSADGRQPGIIDEYEQVLDPTRNRAAKDYFMQVQEGNDLYEYDSPDGKTPKWYKMVNGKRVEAKGWSPKSSKHLKIFKKGDQRASIDFGMSSLQQEGRVPEWMLSPIAQGGVGTGIKTQGAQDND
jgi:hypothetical protein